MYFKRKLSHDKTPEASHTAMELCELYNARPYSHTALLFYVTVNE